MAARRLFLVVVIIAILYLAFLMVAWRAAALQAPEHRMLDIRWENSECARVYSSTLEFDINLLGQYRATESANWADIRFIEMNERGHYEEVAHSFNGRVHGGERICGLDRETTRAQLRYHGLFVTVQII